MLKNYQLRGLHWRGIISVLFAVLLFIPLINIAQTDSIPPDQTGIRNLTSVQLSKEMVPGWNVGNSMEAIGGETAWGNPKITQTLVDSIKAAGFKSIRIPVAWSNFMDTSNHAFKIDTTLLARVEEVIKYVLKDSLYAVINEHWDGGWMQPTNAAKAYVNNRFALIWKQIAIRFRDFGDHLIFAGMNEVMVTNNYGTPTPEYYGAHNSFNQTFVTTVRSTGGRNAYRHLAVQGFNTNIDYTYNYFVIPTDVTPNRLMVEVHYYDPYNFTLNTGNGYTTQWGNNATIKTDTWANESYADNQFQKMKTKYINNGYAVLLGEYGVTARLNLGSTALNAQFAGYRRYYMKYITRSLESHGLVPFYWDNGSTGNNSMGIFNRTNGAQAYPDIISAIVDTTTSLASVGVLGSTAIPSKFSLEQNYPNPFNPQTTISYGLSRSSMVTMKVYTVLGGEVGILLNNEHIEAGNHKISFDAGGLSSGVYFYRMQAEDFAETKRMIMIK